MKGFGILMVILILFTGCQSTHVEIDWVDFIHWDGVTYDGIHTGVLVDESLIGEKMGEVNFKVADNVSDPHRKLKNGDAAFHEKGTDIYSINNHPNLIAVKYSDQINGYAVYYSSETSEYEWHFKDMPIDKVNRAEIYQLYTKDGTILINEIDIQEDLGKLLEILIESEENPNFDPNTEQGDPDVYEIVLYTDGPIAYKYGMHFDGTTFYWFPWDIAILAEEMGEYISNE